MELDIVEETEDSIVVRKYYKYCEALYKPVYYKIDKNSVEYKERL